MNQKNQFGPNGTPVNCSIFDARLHDLMDGAMLGEELIAFRSHAESCSTCGPLFTLAEEGRQWMGRLVEVEPPTNLVHNILARTTMAGSAAAKAKAKIEPEKNWLRKLSDFISPELSPMVFRALQPRVAMTFAAAFFSISLGLNMAGIHASDISEMIKNPDKLTTSASIGYYKTTSRVVKYYENIRFVMQIQAITKQLGVTDDKKKEQPSEDKKNEKKPEDNTSEKDKQNRNYFNRDAEALSAVRPPSFFHSVHGKTLS